MTHTYLRIEQQAQIHRDDSSVGICVCKNLVRNVTVTEASTEREILYPITVIEVASLGFRKQITSKVFESEMNA